MSYFITLKHNKGGIMRNVFLAFVVCVVLSFSTGCAVKNLVDSVQKASDAFTALDNMQKAQQQELEKNNIFSMKADDNRASFVLLSPPDYTFNEVTIDPGKAISSALYAKIAEITPRFSVPSSRKLTKANIDAVSTDHMLGIVFG
jgi:hypothetical protein